MNYPASTTSKSLSSFALLLAVAMLASCSALSRPFTGPDADFSGAGGALQPDDDLPCAENCVPKGLRIAVDSTLMDKDFQKEFAQALRNTSAGRFVSMRGQTGEPQFELLVTEMTNNDKWEPSTVGAIVGGLGGAAGGAAADKRWRSRGAAIGGAAGAAAGWLLWSKQQNLWAFEVKFKQRTSAEGRGKIEQKGGSETSSGGSLQGVTGMGAGGTAFQEQVKRVDWDVTSNTAVQTRYFAVAVEGGAFSSEAGRADAAKAALLERLPTFLMGGDVIDF
ncbi:MAG: hypothetical protein NXI31_15405 [bacterium]|nr:hypothetical protein [bacterium]